LVDTHDLRIGFQQAVQRTAILVGNVIDVADRRRPSMPNAGM
jgi:hypothetical protein